MGDAFAAVLPDAPRLVSRRRPQHDVRPERVDALRPFAERQYPPPGQGVDEEDIEQAIEALTAALGSGSRSDRA